eukprot:gene1121-biopygen5776
MCQDDTGANLSIRSPANCAPSLICAPSPPRPHLWNQYRHPYCLAVSGGDRGAVGGETAGVVVAVTARLSSAGLRWDRCCCALAE